MRAVETVTFSHLNQVSYLGIPFVTSLTTVCGYVDNMAAALLTCIYFLSFYLKMYSIVPRSLPDFISQPWRKIRRRPGIIATSRNRNGRLSWYEPSPHYILTESTISGQWCSNDPSPNFSPQLQDKIWEWHGDEANRCKDGMPKSMQTRVEMMHESKGQHIGKAPSLHLFTIQLESAWVFGSSWL